MGVEDGLALLVKSSPHLSTVSKCELFEFLAYSCFKMDSKIVAREILKVGFDHIVESLRSKNHDLRVATMLLLNGLMCGTNCNFVNFCLTFFFRNHRQQYSNPSRPRPRKGRISKSLHRRSGRISRFRSVEHPSSGVRGR